jgi:putrescine transport system substrate-binding protein
VFYANPNTASLKFVRKDIADNKTVFLPPEDLNKMVAPEALPADIRRIVTRTYTKFKTGL